MKRIFVVGCCLAAAALGPAAGAAELSGRVEVVVKGRSAPGEASQAVVWFEPERAVAPAAPARPLEMVTQKKEFSPRVLVAPRGATVAFPNRDPILHNVFSVSETRRFDLGLFGTGEAGRVRFDQGGVVRVFCNVHHDMVGYLLVLDTPFSTVPDARGAFRLPDLPPGRGTLTVWHEQAEPWSRTLVIPAAGAPAGPVEVRIELTKPRVPPHLDKLGRSYRERRRDRYRGD
jgi:plastocyanin